MANGYLGWKKLWGYIDDEENKSPNQIIDDLVDIVSKNGNMLLNVGPKPDGTITEGQQKVLLEIGDWLKVNGEAIYDTHPWIKAVEGNVEGTSGAFLDNKESVYTAQDIRFTKKENVVYAVSLEWDVQGVIIKSIDNSFKVVNVTMLGASEKLEWNQTKEGLKVAFPKDKPCEYAYAL